MILNYKQTNLLYTHTRWLIIYLFKYLFCLLFIPLMNRRVKGDKNVVGKERELNLEPSEIKY